MNFWSAQARLAPLSPKAGLWARVKHGFARRKREHGDPVGEILPVPPLEKEGT
jgi:hypothetical protein